MLGGEVVVAEVGALRVGRLEHLVGLGAERRVLGGLAVDLGLAGERLVDAVADDLRRDADPLEDRQHHALGLAHQGGEQVLGGDLGVVLVARQGLRGGEGLSGLAGQLVGVEGHAFTFTGSGSLVGRRVRVVPKVDNDTVNFIPPPWARRS